MKSINKILVLWFIIMVSSCAKNDEMLTRINVDGSCYREFKVHADSAFMVGDTGKSKILPVDLNSNWKISWQYITPELHSEWPLKSWIKDTSQRNKEVTVWIRCNYKSVSEMASSFKLKKTHKWNDLKINYFFEKKFRWFYTYFTYSETYPKIKTLDRIPLSKYFTEEEAEFWFNGKQDLLKGMNGIEIQDFTEKLEGKFNQWLGHNMLDAEYEILIKNYDQLKEKSISKEQLLLEKEKFIESNMDKIAKSDNTNIGKCLDNFFKTKVFSEFYNKKENPLQVYEKDFGNQEFTKYFENDMDYKLIMSGKVLKADNAIVHGDTLSWKLTAYRMVYSNYRISAQSRKANIWAFVLSACIVMVAIGSLIYKAKY